MSGGGRRDPGQDDLTEGPTLTLSPEGWNGGGPVLVRRLPQPQFPRL